METRKKLTARTLSKDKQLHAYEYRNNNLILDRGDGTSDNNLLGDIGSHNFEVDCYSHQGRVTIDKSTHFGGEMNCEFRGLSKDRDGSWKDLGGNSCELKEGREIQYHYLP